MGSVLCHSLTFFFRERVVLVLLSLMTMMRRVQAAHVEQQQQPAAEHRARLGLPPVLRPLGAARAAAAVSRTKNTDSALVNNQRNTLIEDSMRFDDLFSARDQKRISASTPERPEAEKDVMIVILPLNLSLFQVVSQHPVPWPEPYPNTGSHHLKKAPLIPNSSNAVLLFVLRTTPAIRH